MYLTSKNKLGYSEWLLLYTSKRGNPEFLLSDILAGKSRLSSLSTYGLCNSNYWAWVLKLKSRLEIAMPFVLANYCLNTSPHRCTVQVSGRYGNYASWLPDRIISIWPLKKPENGEHLTDHKESGTELILREKWRPAGTDFKGSNFRDFSVPPGHMACMQRLHWVTSLMAYLSSTTNLVALRLWSGSILHTFFASIQLHACIIKSDPIPDLWQLFGRIWPWLGSELIL